MRHRPIVRFATAACLLVLLAAGLAGQYPRRDPIEQAREELLRQGLKDRHERARRMQNYAFPYSALPKDAPWAFHFANRAGLRQMFSAYEGLPTYPSNVPGYGGYPGAGKVPDETTPRRIPAMEKVPVDKDRWPSWIEGGTGKQAILATPERAVLVRITDRVWFRAPDEAAFIPLVFHDRFRFTTVGAQVEVRGQGEFQFVMHAGGRIRSRGPCALTVTEMNRREVALRFTDVSQLWIHAGLRPFQITMPDGTSVEFTDTLLRIERRGDRCRLSNLGSSPIRITGPFGKVELDGPRTIELWMRPASQQSFTNQLDTQGDIATQQLGGVTTIRGGTDGRVTWSGASFQVPGGSTLEIKSLRSADPRK